MNNTKLRGTARKRVAVALTRQPLLPLCASVIEERTKAGLDPIRLDYSEVVNDSKPRLWLDAKLFKEALRELFDQAVCHSNDSEPVAVSIHEAMNSWLISISLMPRKSADAEFSEPRVFLRLVSSRVREIISQHRAKTIHRMINKRGCIDISFEN